MPRGGYNRKPLHERSWKGETAAAYGCTVTFEAEDGMTLTMSRVGAPRATLRALCAEAVAIDLTYRVVSYSTPETIRHDLRGRFDDAHQAKAQTGQPAPEGKILSSAGLLPMLHPRLRGTHPAAMAKYRDA
jgi:hypothetical protein